MNRNKPTLTDSAAKAYAEALITAAGGTPDKRFTYVWQGKALAFSTALNGLHGIQSHPQITATVDIATATHCVVG